MKRTSKGGTGLHSPSGDTKQMEESNGKPKTKHKEAKSHFQDHSDTSTYANRPNYRSRKSKQYLEDNEKEEGKPKVKRSPTKFARFNDYKLPPHAGTNKRGTKNNTLLATPE
jgi:hypothetical protein